MITVAPNSHTLLTRLFFIVVILDQPYSCNQVHSAKHEINNLDASERHYYTAQSPDKQVPSEQSVSSERYILHALQRDRDERRYDERVEDDRRQYRGGRRVKMHNVHRLDPWQGAGEKSRNNRKVLGNVVGHGKRRQRTTGHEKLLANLDDLKELGWIGIKVNHVPGFLCCLGPRVHSQAHVRLCQRRSVIGAVTDHRDQLAFSLILADISELRLGCAFGDEVIHSRALRNRCGSQRIVAGDHYGVNSHPMEPLEPLTYSGFQDVFEYHHTDRLLCLSDYQRGSAPGSNAVHECLQVFRDISTQFLDVTNHSVRRAFANLLSIGQVDTAHPGLRSERNKTDVAGID